MGADELSRAKEWLSSCITTRGDNDTPLWGAGIGDFEQGLRNGYALAHLARSLGGPECQSGIYNVRSRFLGALDWN